MEKSSELEKQSNLIIENATTEIKKLINTSLQLQTNKNIIKEKAKDIIAQCSKDLKDINASEDLIKQTKKALTLRFVDWFNQSIQQMQMLYKKTNAKVVANTLIAFGVKPIPSKQTKSIYIGEEIDVMDYLTDANVGAVATYTEEENNLVMQIKNGMEEIATQVNNHTLTLKDSKGRNMSIRNLATMQARYDIINKNIARLNEKGVKFAIASTHSNCSERCSFWQGKIFLLDAAPEEIKGQYKAKNKPTPKIIGHIDGKPYYSLKQALKNGFLGYNCQHRLVEYKKGMKPIEYPAKEIDKRRKDTQKQRYLERKIRQAKADEVNPFFTKEERKQAIAKSKAYQKKYKDFSRANNLPVYRWRCSITDTERKLTK